CAAAVRPTNMRPPEMHPTAAACPEAYSAAVPAKPAAVSATTMPTATAAMSPATMPAAPATASVSFECEKRHDDEQHHGNARAGRQHQPYGATGLGAPHRRGRLSLGVSPRTKSF